MENNNKIRELYSIYLELGNEVFEEIIKKPMELYLHDNSNVITMNALNTIISSTTEKSKLGEASIYDLFSSLALEEKICSDDILSPVGDIFKLPTESAPFKIPMRIVEKVMDERYAGDGTVHPSDHLLKLKELCELFKVAGLSR